MEEKTLAILKKTGLTDGESKVYFALLSIGTSSVSKIIEGAGISASKIYFVLDKLIQKGLVTVSVKNKIKIFTASDPERVIEYLHEKANSIKRNEEEVLKILPSLKARKGSIKNYPPIEFTKGMKGYESVFTELFGNMNVGDVYIGLAGNRMSFKMQDYWYKHSNLLAEKKIFQFLAYEQDVWYKKDPKIHQRKKRKRYYPRVLSSEYKDIPNITLYGDQTMISDVDDDGEIFVLLVRNKNLSISMKKLVKSIYLSGKVPEGYKLHPPSIKL